MAEGAPVEASVLSRSPSPAPAAAAAEAMVHHRLTATFRSMSGRTVAPPYTLDFATAVVQHTNTPTGLI